MLADLGRVAGDLYIDMDDRAQVNLSCLNCVHTIDGFLTVRNNALLESTEGMDNLESVEAITIVENLNLRAVTGFSRVRSLWWFEAHSNSSLEEIKFDSLESAKSLRIGLCEGMKPLGSQQALVALSGFSGLTMVETLAIEGNEGLISEGLLEALKANGAASALASATFRYNALLDEATIHARLDALGVGL